KHASVGIREAELLHQLRSGREVAAPRARGSRRDSRRDGDGLPALRFHVSQHSERPSGAARYFAKAKKTHPRRQCIGLDPCVINTGGRSNGVKEYFNDAVKTEDSNTPVLQHSVSVLRADCDLFEQSATRQWFRGFTRRRP